MDFIKHLGRQCRSVTCLIAGLTATNAIQADGIYVPVELKRKEPIILIETADQLNGQFERRSLLFGDDAVVSLVRTIGHALAPEPTDAYMQYQFFVLRDPSPNAFALLNGQIYVHTGMLARLNDESQLAGLLAHEITHVAGHHSIVQYRVSAKEFFAGVFTGGFGTLMSELALSRELEQEADDRASLVLAHSNYDPHALPELFEVLAQDFEGLSPRVASMWTTHPEPEARAAASRRLVSNLPTRERDPELFDEVIFPLRILTIRDYIQDDYPYTAIALAGQLVEE